MRSVEKLTNQSGSNSAIYIAEHAEIFKTGITNQLILMQIRQVSMPYHIIF